MMFERFERGGTTIAVVREAYKVMQAYLYVKKIRTETIRNGGELMRTMNTRATTTYRIGVIILGDGYH